MHPASSQSIDAFIDALWLEQGLSKNTLSAYRRDLSLFAAWLWAQGMPLDDTLEHQINAYFSARHASTKATSANRRLTVFKRYFRWALRERRIAADPTLKLRPARQALRVPKTLTELEVEALLAAPDVDTALGVRDRTMLELMYASGLRVSELVTLRTLNVSLNDNVLRVFGKGSKERLVPFGEVASSWLKRYLADTRPALLGQRQVWRCSSPPAAATRAAACRVSCSGTSSRNTRCGPASPRRRHRITCATRLRPTCSTTGRTCVWCRCCWATPTFRPPRSTPTWRVRASRYCMRSTIRAVDLARSCGLNR